MTEEHDFLEGLNDITSSVGNQETASDAYQGTGQKGLDYSQLEYDVVIFKPAEDRQPNKFDIIPFIVKEPWYEKLLFPPPTVAQKEAGQKYARLRGRKVGQADICMEIPFHRFADGDSGDAVCLREAFGEKCPHCELFFKLHELKKQGDPKAEGHAGELKISWRTFFNIFNHLTISPDEDGHDGYEVIDDMGRGALKKYIDICSKDTQLGENFVYPYAHPTQGYTLLAPSIFNAPTSKKYGRGYTEFPIITFEKRADGVDFTEDIPESISFDTLVTPLIFTYEEMEEMLNRKKIKMKIEDIEPEETYDTDQSADNYVGSTKGNGINDIPEQETGTTADGDAIDDTPAYSQTASAGRVGRRNRSARTSTADETQANQSSEPPVEEKKSSGRRRRR